MTSPTIPFAGVKPEPATPADRQCSPTMPAPFRTLTGHDFARSIRWARTWVNPVTRALRAAAR
jgi:hypothetical protein